MLVEEDEEGGGGEEKEIPFPFGEEVDSLVHSLALNVIGGEDE